MNVQKTMEFIVEQQARVAAMQAQHDARIAEIEKLGLKTDKRLDALAKIVKFGMKVVLKQAESIKTQADSIKEMRETQHQQNEETNQHLNALIQVVDDLVKRRPT